MSSPGVLRDWIEALPEYARYVFTRDDAQSVSSASPAAVRMTLLRFKKRGAIASPRRGFYALVPPEYRSAGCSPATWFIHDLLRHLGRRYYVALLTAAAVHGAGHQQPMVFQVIADAVERGIGVGRVRADFHVSNLVGSAATQTMQPETGSMVVSTPETTAFDLVRFPAASGYWSNIATVLSELAEQLDLEQLAAGAARVARSDTQRLGWLLDFLEKHDLAEALADVSGDKRLVPTTLSPAQDTADTNLDPRRRVLVNDVVEPDL